MALPIDHMTLAKPLHVQRVEQSLSLEPFLNYVEGIVNTQNLCSSDVDDTTEGDTDITKDSDTDTDGNKSVNGIITTKAERKADKTRLYNFSKVKKSRKWLKNILLSDSSSDEEEDVTIGNDQMKQMLKLHHYRQQCTNNFTKDKELQQYQYYGVGLLSNVDKFYDHQKMIVGPKKKVAKDQKKLDKKMKAKLKKIKKEKKDDGIEAGEIDSRVVEAMLKSNSTNGSTGKPHKVKKLTPEQIAARRRKIYTMIAKKEIPKAQKQKASARKEMLTNLRKISHQCVKECRREAMQSQRVMKETPMRARRLTREMLTYWKRFEKVEKEHRKRAEKEAQEQRKLDLELREMRRQQRKLNFLITQTELYAHFMSRKLTGDSTRQDTILQRLSEGGSSGQHREVRGSILTDQEADDYNPEAMKNLALRNAGDAYACHQSKIDAFDHSVKRPGKPVTNQSLDSMNLSNPAISTEVDAPQPSIFEGKLKGYQLKGMNWLANLYNQGINGILADEMGLGKTVQSISLLGHLAEAQGIWGPFLIIAPASTLHNWQQELARFIPTFKVVPYWGNLQDRKILRKFWNQDYLHTQDASFHVVITSYQLVIQDVKYFQRIKWQYMILDEAQAIKSSSSARWKTLLGFNCRNRMLLTGTPIQNSMAELWALLHFIMPTLFDSHEEFGEWFSKDIESHAEKQSGIDENQLSRLHMILKPFMLRRIKKDVENELSDKIEILVYCPLTRRQKLLYQAVKNKIRIEDLLQSSSGSSQSANSANSLMNFVMQFRKVCNHPELFERREVRGPFYMKLDPYYIPKLIFRDGILHRSVPSREKLLYNLLYIFSPNHIHQSLFHSVQDHGVVDSCFSWLRFINTSAQEMYELMFSGLLVRWLAVFLWLKEAYRIHCQDFWQETLSSNNQHQPLIRPLGKTSFLLSPLSTMSPANITTSSHLPHLVFTGVTRCIYTHDKVTLHYMAETDAHRKVRLHKHDKLAIGSPNRKHPGSPPHSPSKKSLAFSESSPHPHILRPPKVLPCQPVEMPSFLHYTLPKMRAGLLGSYCTDRSASWCSMREALCGTLHARNSLLYGNTEICEEVRYKRYYFHPTTPAGLNAISPKYGYSGVYVPDKETLVTDAGKLYVLDTLLARLKSEGHRVLIYSQMTKVIDLLEEYMWHRKHTYMRLDGSSKISERRDMVADFQSKSDIFVFLLSTRAGGLGINLTAADTVIFYDSDWNPTVDQQAMDRAHRLGQTKQVTVYRLICKGTIEERILQRAKEKSEIQRMVISGGNFRPDVLKPKEVVSLLLDDDEMERKLRQKQEEKGGRDDTDKKRKKIEKKKEVDGRKKRRSVAATAAVEEVNVTIPAPDTDSMVSMDSTSAAASPQSVMSVGSELNPALFSLPAEDSSNDGLLIVDDAHTSFPPVSADTPPPPKRGRGRGRPRGSGSGRRPRGRGSLKKALSAAEIAGAQAGMTAAYKAYGYNLAGSTPPPSSRKSTRGSRTSNNGTPSGSGLSTPADSPHSQQSQGYT